MENKFDIKECTLPELEAFIQELGESPFRARQIFTWIYQKGESSFLQMTDLSKTFRKTLQQRACISRFEGHSSLVSKDGTRKYRFRLEDGGFIESVYIPERTRRTLCLSTQAGCPLKCRFCLTGQRRFVRNLSTAEIINQLCAVQSDLSPTQRISNVVFMGMGEPLLNYGSLVRAIRIMTNDHGLNFSTRRITVSTVGIVPQMRLLGEETQVNLAVSLNATNDEVRTFLMPINERYSLSQVLEACRRYPLAHRKRITMEYVLIAGQNDFQDDVRRLDRLLKPVRAKVNLIPFNPFPGCSFEAPPVERVIEFHEDLVSRNIPCMMRASKGADVGAACGQLGGTENQMLV